MYLPVQRWLLTVGSVLALVTIGGQCRGSLAGAQERTLATLDGAAAEPRKIVRTSPMTAAEWSRTYDECVKHLGQPIILAGRHPGISAGVGCLIED
jgi:hypothetical protein